MIKFKTLQDVQMFLADVGKYSDIATATLDYKPTADLEELYIKARKSIIPKLKDFRKSQNAKQSWRANRYNIMKGIHSFHSSTTGNRYLQ